MSKSRASNRPLPEGWKRGGILPYFQALLIVAAGLWVFWPALHGGWLMDDDLSVTANPLLHDPGRFWKMWVPGNYYDYFPINATVQWVQWGLWGDDTFGYHLTNVVLHILSSLLVWRLLGKFGLRLAWLGGLLFAIHPVVVESVAWIVELKNALSLPPFLLSMCAYIDYEEHRRSRDYRRALVWFVVAMLCKVSMALFPLVILLYAWWKRGRVGWSDVRDAAPFFAVSLALGATTLVTQHWYRYPGTPARDSVDPGGFFSRLALAGTSISFYFLHCVWPARMLPVYPKWSVNPPSLVQFLPWPILGGVVAWFWLKRRSWGRHALLGLGFFLINLAPFLGFMATPYMHLAWVMDHLLYIPIIGLIGLVVAALGTIGERLPSPLRWCGMGALAALVAILAFKSRSYAGRFVDQETLLTYALRYNPDSAEMQASLGTALLHDGRSGEAILHYERALSINPDFASARYSLGTALLQNGRAAEAVPQLEWAVRLKPDAAAMHNNLGIALFQSGRAAEAIGQFEEALRINPDFADARRNFERARQAGGKPESN